MCDNIIYGDIMMKDIYAKLKGKYVDTIVIMKYGNFYRVFGHDAIILKYITGYKYNNNRLGFPITEIDRIIDRIKELKCNCYIYNREYINFVDNQYNIIYLYSIYLVYKDELIEHIKEFECTNELEDIYRKYDPKLLESIKLKYE